jgi:hypothetical protein
MKLTPEMKAFLDAMSVGFGEGVDLAAYAATVPEPKDYTGLEVGIRQDDGTIETLVMGEDGFEKR